MNGRRGFTRKMDLCLLWQNWSGTTRQKVVRTTLTRTFRGGGRAARPVDANRFDTRRLLSRNWNILMKKGRVAPFEKTAFCTS